MFSSAQRQAPPASKLRETFAAAGGEISFNGIGLLTYCVTLCTTFFKVLCMQQDDDGSFGKLEQELRRGVVVIAVLSQLSAPQYGYSLRQALAERGMPIEEGTLYPMLRRLESQGLLASEWKIEDGPPRRYYALSPAGKQLLKRLTASWRGVVETMDGLLGGRRT
jgi:DNA-binding PadR family transcriptional regulator